MNFLEASEKAKLECKTFRRKMWPSGVVAEWKGDEIIYYHVAACALPAPPESDLEENDWILVIDYGKDIGFQWK